MKYKMLVLILLLTVMSWAQSATPSASSTPQQSTVPADQGKCACCDKIVRQRHESWSYLLRAAQHGGQGRQRDAIAELSSTSSAAVNFSRRRVNRASETSTGVRVIPSAYSRTSRSKSEKLKSER